MTPSLATVLPRHIVYSAVGSTTSKFHGVAAQRECRDDLVAMIALNLDHVILHGAARSTKALELAGELSERAFCNKNAVYGRDGLPATFAGFAANTHDAVAAWQVLLCGC